MFALTAVLNRNRMLMSAAARSFIELAKRLHDLQKAWDG